MARYGLQYYISRLTSCGWSVDIRDKPHLTGKRIILWRGQYEAYDIPCATGREAEMLHEVCIDLVKP